MGVVGIDLNLNDIAFVADSDADLLPFAAKVPTLIKKIKKLQRKMARSTRLSNPDNFAADFEAKKGRKTVKKKGKVKKGIVKNGKRQKLQWNNSNRYKKVSAKRREIERRKTAYAKSQNRRVVNDILRYGNIIKAENVSVKGWQKRWGKRINEKSPGFVQSELKRKAESAGGQFIKFPCQLALSQTHLDGQRVKKSLSERVHYDQTGIVMHRDLFSAYLARHVDENKLSLLDAAVQYPGMEPSLLEAWERYKESASKVSSSEIRCNHRPSEQISSNLRKSVPDQPVGLKAAKGSEESPRMRARGGSK